MAIQKAVDNLKEQPKEDRVAVASGIAVTVIVLLLFVWGFFFLKKLQRGEPLEFGSSAQDEFNFSSVREAQKEIDTAFKYTQDELRAIRDSSAESATDLREQEFELGVEEDQFVTDTSF